MNKDLLKRVGMLTAATAVCTAGVFGALAVNGLRYMRPTTDNWWLLPWVAPAARIEQSVMDFGEGDPTYTVTGYDAQNREIWSSTTFGKLASVGSSRDVYIGNISARYFFGQGGKADSVCQYDEQGRLIRMETDYGGISTYSYRGDATETYLEETHNAQGALTGRKITETDPQTGSTVTNMDIYEDDGTYLASQYCILDSHGNIVKQVHVSAGGQMRTCDYQWTYDDAARTATCVDEAEGTTEKYWYDEQGRWIKNAYSFSEDGFSREITTTYTDVTR